MPASRSPSSSTGAPATCASRATRRWRRASPRTRGRNAADHAIAQRVEADADPGSIRVVTSDRELADRVRAAGADVEGAGRFRERLDAV